MLSLTEIKELHEQISIQEQLVLKMAIEYTRTNCNERLLNAVYVLRSLYNKREIDRDELAEKFHCLDEG